MIIAVIGTPGSGKTYWIREQIAKTNLPVIYFSPKTDSFPLDAIYLQSEFPHLSILSTGEEEKILARSEESIIFIELPWYLDLLATEPLLQRFNCHRVAIMPPEIQNTGFHAWANEVIPGNSLKIVKLDKQIQIHRGVLTGEILDFASLETFWQELVEGAYGEIIRVKGIFDIMDGQAIYGELIDNLPVKDFQPLNLPRWIEGRPQRFSGLEIIGRNLVKEQIAQTLQDCCLLESAIRYYQEQIKESLTISPI